MQCSKCGREPVIFQQYSGRHLCREHLVADIESRIKRDIRTGRWMRPGDHLAVALSGSKSSRALLFFFHNLTRRRRDIRLSAIVIDEGIEGYRDVSLVMELTETLKIPCHLGSFKDAFRLIPASERDDPTTSSCPRCREIRRRLIETIAAREGITRIISGITLEDRATEILGNILLGNVDTYLSETRRTSPVPWIDPMGSIPGAEADLYADFLCPGPGISACPNRRAGFSDEVGDLLEEYSKRHPATPYSLSVIKKTLLGSSRTFPGIALPDLPERNPGSTGK